MLYSARARVHSPTHRPRSGKGLALYVAYAKCSVFIEEIVPGLLQATVGGVVQSSAAATPCPGSNPTTTPIFFFFFR